MHPPFKIKFCFVFYFIILCLNCSLFSQQLVYKFQQFSTNEGLPSSEIHKVLNDSRNYLWLATDHGVCRYDGNDFKVFNLPDNSILSMFEDVKNRIWCITFSGRLFYFDNNRFSPYRHNDTVLKYTSQFTVSQIYVDSADNVYVNSLQPKSFVINASGKATNLLQNGRDWTFNIIEKAGGGYFPYLEKWHDRPKETITYPFKHDDLFIKIRIMGKDLRIRDLFYGVGTKSGAEKLSDGSVIFFQYNKIFRIFPNGNYRIKTIGSFILDVKEIEQNRLFVATLDRGLLVLNSDDEIISNYFPKQTVSDIETDYEGGIWISTTSNGLFYLSSLKMKHLSENQSILNRHIETMEVTSGGGIWAGGSEKGLIYFEPDSILQVYNFPFLSIHGIHTGYLRDTLVVTSGELKDLDIDKIYYLKEGRVMAAGVQGNSDLIKIGEKYFTGSTLGVAQLDFQTMMRTFENAENFRVTSLYLDHKGDLLVGNLFGLWRFRNRRLYPYDSTLDILKTRITDIEEFREKYLCLGTRGKGLLMSVNDSVFQITTEKGLSSDNIRKIFIDGDIIWLASNRGVSKLTVQSLSPFTYTIRNISVQDGLLSNEVNDIMQFENEMIVASKTGITFFSKSLYSGNQQSKLSVYLDAVKLNGIDTAIRPHFTLNKKEGNLALTFVAISYRQSANIEFRYKLSGADTNWVSMTGRDIQFTPFPFGRYKLTVQARREGEEWADENSVTLTINRFPPFWKSIWFEIAIFLVAALLIILFFTRRTRLIRQRERERTSLNKRVAEMEMKALRAQMNPHFIFNVLNSIQYFITHDDNDNAQYYMSKFAKLVRQTLDNSRSTFISLEDELSLLRLYIDLEKIRFEDRFDYSIKIESGIATNSVRIPNMLLQPYVENSIKHGFKGKEEYFLEIRIFMEGENIICEIEDDGIGRELAAKVPSPEKQGHSSTGTALINEKIEALRYYFNYNLVSKTTDIKDNDNNICGTRVTLIFPAKFEIQ